MLSASVDRNVVDFDKHWPRLVECGYGVDDNAPYPGFYVDTLHNLGCCLVIAGALAFAADAALRAGIDLGIALVAKEMQDDAMRQAPKGKTESILAPSRQLILPGSEGWGKKL